MDFNNLKDKTVAITGGADAAGGAVSVGGKLAATGVAIGDIGVGAAAEPQAKIAGSIRTASANMIRRGARPELALKLESGILSFAIPGQPPFLRGFLFYAASSPKYY